MVGTVVGTVELEDRVIPQLIEAGEDEMLQLDFLPPPPIPRSVLVEEVAVTRPTMTVHQAIHHAVAEDVVEVVTMETSTGAEMLCPHPSTHKLFYHSSNDISHMLNPKYVMHKIIKGRTFVPTL